MQKQKDGLLQNGIELNGGVSSSQKPNNTYYTTADLNNGNATALNNSRAASNGIAVTAYASPVVAPNNLIQSSTQNILEDTDDDDDDGFQNGRSDRADNARNAAIAAASATATANQVVASSSNRGFETEDAVGVRATVTQRAPSPHIYANQLNQAFYPEGPGIYQQQQIMTK